MPELIADGPLFVGGVLVLDDASDFLAVAQHAPIAGGVFHFGRQDGDDVAPGAVHGDQAAQGVAGEHGNVGVGHHDVAGEVIETVKAALHGVSGTELLVLDRHGHALRQLVEMADDLLALMPDHHDEVFGIEGLPRR